MGKFREGGDFPSKGPEKKNYILPSQHIPWIISVGKVYIYSYVSAAAIYIASFVYALWNVTTLHVNNSYSDTDKELEQLVY